LRSFLAVGLLPLVQTFSVQIENASDAPVVDAVDIEALVLVRA
jgi:hypothetical protein